MRSFFKWLGGILGSLVIIALAALAFIYVKSDSVINKKFDVTHNELELTIPNDSASIAEGERLTRIRGCAGCHGPELKGEVMAEFGISSLLVAPNLTKVTTKYSVAKLEKIIRHGVQPDKTSMVVMPSDVFNQISNNDLEKILAYLDSLPEKDNPEHPESRLGPMIRYFIAMGNTDPFPAYHIDQEASHIDSARKIPIKRFGNYLVTTNCTECHGMDLKGGEVAGHAVPPLAMVKGYSQQDFKKLMNTGIGLGGRKLGLMAKQSKNFFQHFTDKEIEALYKYLSEVADSTRQIRFRASNNQQFQKTE